VSAAERRGEAVLEERLLRYKKRHIGEGRRAVSGGQQKNEAQRQADMF